MASIRSLALDQGPAGRTVAGKARVLGGFGLQGLGFRVHINQEVRYRETGESLSLLSRRQSPLIGSEEKFNSTHGEYSGTETEKREKCPCTETPYQDEARRAEDNMKR